MTCIGIKISPKLNRIFRSKRRGEKKKLEEKGRKTEDEEEVIGLRKNNFYYSLEVHDAAVMLPSSRSHSNVYSWLFSQDVDECYPEHYPASSSNSSPALSSLYSSSSECFTSRLSDPFIPSQEENSFSKRSSNIQKLAGSILSGNSSEPPPKTRSELHYASTDILSFPWRQNAACQNLERSETEREPTEYVYLDISSPASEGWMLTRKPSPVRSAYI